MQDLTENFTQYFNESYFKINSEEILTGRNTNNGIKKSVPNPDLEASCMFLERYFFTILNDPRFFTKLSYDFFD